MEAVVTVLRPEIALYVAVVVVEQGLDAGAFASGKEEDGGGALNSVLFDGAGSQQRYDECEGVGENGIGTEPCCVSREEAVVNDDGMAGVEWQPLQ